MQEHLKGKKSKRRKNKDKKAESRKEPPSADVQLDARVSIEEAEPQTHGDYDNVMKQAESCLDRYKTLARENIENQKLEEAQRCLEKAVYLAISAYGPAHQEVGTNLRDLSSVMYQRGMHEAAAPLMARAERIMRAAG